MNLVEEIVKPVTLTLRLFGNLLSGALMLSLIAALGSWKLGAIPLGNILVIVRSTTVWKLFDMAIGAIQAFIFALLTILYFDTAMSTTTARTWTTWCGSSPPTSRSRPTWPGRPEDVRSPGTTSSDRSSATPTQKENHDNGRHRRHKRSSWPAPWSAAAWRWAAAPSARPSATAWPVARRSPAWPASPRPRAA